MSSPVRQMASRRLPPLQGAGANTRLSSNRWRPRIPHNSSDPRRGAHRSHQSQTLQDMFVTGRYEYHSLSRALWIAVSAYTATLESVYTSARADTHTCRLPDTCMIDICCCTQYKQCISSISLHLCQHRSVVVWSLRQNIKSDKL